MLNQLKTDVRDLSSVKDKLLNIISEIIEVDKELIEGKEDVNIFAEFDVDSLLGLEIVAEIEKCFDIKIEDEKIDTLETTNEIYRLVVGYF